MISGLRILLIMFAALFFVACASSSNKSYEAEKNRRIAEANTQLALTYIQRNELKIAQEKIEKALAADPISSGAHHAMALLKWRLAEHEKAEFHFKQSLKYKHQDPDVMNNYGAFLCDRRQIDTAIGLFKQALADTLYQNRAQTNANIGSCLMKKSAMGEAEKYFMKALKMDRNETTALYYMAQIRQKTGYLRSASDYMRRYFKYGPDTPETLLLAVKIERALGHKNNEASYAVRLKGKFPDSTEAKSIERSSLRVR